MSTAVNVLIGYAVFCLVVGVVFTACLLIALWRSHDDKN